MSSWPPVLEVGEEAVRRLASPGDPRRGRVRSRGHSLFCDDILLGQGRALHPGNLHPVGDLGEIQAQVHATDGHPRPSFWGA